MDNTIKSSASIIVLFFLGILINPAQSLAKPLDIAFDNNKVNIYSENEKLSSIANGISAAAGITVYVDRSLENMAVSVDIRNASFEKGIKMLTYPLNYVIIKDDGGNIKELRIFKNPGNSNSAYLVFSSSNGKSATGSQLTAASQSANQPINQSANQSTSQSANQSATGSATSGTGARMQQSAAGDTDPVTGDRALNYGMWVAKRMMEVDMLKQQTQMRTDQIESVKKDVAAVSEAAKINTINVAANQQGSMNMAPNPNVSPSSNVAPSSNMPPNYSVSVAQGPSPSAANSVNYSQYYQQPPPTYTYNNNGNNMDQMRYMQSMSQRNGFNNFIYYQQRMYSVMTKK